MQQLIQEIARQRQSEVNRVSRRSPETTGSTTPDRVVIRLATQCDDAVLEQLGALEEALVLPGSWLVAEADGSVAAALRLEDGTVLANPFARTLELRGVLELWAHQLTGRRRRRWLAI